MKYLVILFLLLNSAFAVLGQTQNQTVKQNEQDARNQEILRREEEAKIESSFRRLRSLDNLINGSSDTPLPPHSYIYEPRLTKEQKTLIMPAKDDLSKYSSFLDLPKTGIFKILSAPNCGNEKVIDVNNEKCFNLPNKSLSYYSFRKHLYAPFAWSDLNYKETQFIVGFEKMTVGLVGEIGDLAIESLSKDSTEIKSLLAVNMPKQQPQIKAMKEEIEKGIYLNGKKFSHSIEAKLNHTYLLRTFAYRHKATAANDRRIDLIVAFKVVGEDADKGLTIIWKEIYKGDSHKI